jgi:hypothetical protein
MDEEDARYAAEMAAISAELAVLPAPPDPAMYARAARQFDALAAALAAAPGEALRALLLDAGTVVLSPAGIVIRWRPVYRDFVPAPAVVPHPGLLDS